MSVEIKLFGLRTEPLFKLQKSNDRCAVYYFFFNCFIKLIFFSFFYFHYLLLSFAEEYLNYCLQYPVHHMKCVRSHVMKMLHRYTTVHVELRDLIGNSHTYDDYFAVCNRVRVLMQESGRVDADYTCSWYRRYRQTLTTTDGGDIIVQKPVCTSKDNMVNLATSFNHGLSTEDGEDPWSTGGGESCGGIFESLFSYA